jgi:hypothetical protein
MVVIAIIALLAALLLPALSTAKKKALRRSMDSAGATPAKVESPEFNNLARAGSPRRLLATVRSFSATVSLKPGLSEGTSQPESICTAQLNTKFEAFNPAGTGECEVLLPLACRARQRLVSIGTNLPVRCM